MLMHDFRQELNIYFPELETYLRLMDDTPSDEAISKICKLVGFREPIYHEPLQPLLYELMEHMKKNREKYFYWIL